MKNKKGFTLVELLAVIVVLGIIMAVAGTAALKIKKNADIEAAKKLEQSLTDLGPSIYSYEMMQQPKVIAGDDSNPLDGNFSYNYKKILQTENSLDGLGVDERKSYQGYSLLITTSKLQDASYLKSSTLKIGNQSCNGFIRIYKTPSGPYFEGNICCDGIYSTNKGDGAVGDNCENYYKENDSTLNISNYTPSYLDNGTNKQRQGWVTSLTE